MHGSFDNRDNKFDSSYRRRKLRRRAISGFLGHVWQFGTTTATCAAVLLGLHQLEVQRELQRNQDAYTIYNEMLLSSMTYSDFTCVDTDEKLQYLKETVDPTSLNGNKLYVKYNTYRQIVMSSLERILIAAPDQDDWKVSVRIRVRCFAPYLRSPEFTQERYKGWKCPLRNIMAEEIGVTKFSCTPQEMQAERQNKL
ncbi:MAG: hypothetical protein QM667_02860 [Asticcacaulis sp.]